MDLEAEQKHFWKCEVEAELASELAAHADVHRHDLFSSFLTPNFLADCTVSAEATCDPELFALDGVLEETLFAEATLRCDTPGSSFITKLVGNITVQLEEPRFVRILDTTNLFESLGEHHYF